MSCVRIMAAAAPVVDDAYLRAYERCACLTRSPSLQPPHSRPRRTAPATESGWISSCAPRQKELMGHLPSALCPLCPLIPVLCPRALKPHRSPKRSARRDLRFYLTQRPEAVVCFLRLAWHDAASYCSRTRTGGANGSLRTEKELAHKANEGLAWAAEALEGFKAKHAVVRHVALPRLRRLHGGGRVLS